MVVATDKLKISRLDNMLSSATSARNRSVGEWNTNYKMAQGMQWDNKANQWFNEIRPVANKIEPIISSFIGWMTDQDISFDIRPNAPYSKYSEWLSKLTTDLTAILSAVWFRDSWLTQIETALEDACKTGVGWLKAGWNTNLNNGQGDIEVTYVSTWDMLVDPNAISSYKCRYYIQHRRMSLAEIESIYPERVEEFKQNLLLEASDSNRPSRSQTTNANLGVLQNMPGSTSPNQWGLTTNSVPFSASELVDIYETWELIKSSTYTNGKWRKTTWGHNVILDEELAEDIIGTNTQPFARIVLRETGDFYPYPFVSSLVSAQKYYNRLLASMQYNAELTGNPIFLEPVGVDNPSPLMDNKPGSRLKWNGGGGQPPPSFMNPPSVSGSVMQTMQIWDTFLEESSGVSGLTSKDSQQGTALQESGLVRVRQALRCLESALRHIGQVCIQLVLDAYSIEHWENVLGEDGTISYYALIAHKDESKFNWSYVLRVDAGSDKPTSRQARIAEADSLYAMGAVSMKYVLNAHRISNPDEIIKEKMQEQQLAQMMSPAPVPPSRGMRGRIT